MIRLAVLWLALLVQPVLSEPWACTFTVRCLAGHSCDAADLELEVIAADHEGQLFLRSAAEADPATRLDPGTFAAQDQLLTITPDGTATLTQHREAIATYFGTCAVLE